MKARETPKYISLDQATASVTTSAPKRTFINCLPSNDLEMWFLGTIFCEMGDLDQTPLQQTLINLWDWEYELSEHSFMCLKGHLTV